VFFIADQARNRKRFCIRKDLYFLNFAAVEVTEDGEGFGFIVILLSHDRAPIF
jgi:hypothetical protein